MCIIIKFRVNNILGPANGNNHPKLKIFPIFGIYRLEFWEFEIFSISAQFFANFLIYFSVKFEVPQSWSGSREILEY